MNAKQKKKAITYFKRRIILLPIFSLEHPVHILMSLALSNGLLMEKPLKKFNYKNEPTKE